MAGEPVASQAVKKYKAFTGSPVLVDPTDICNAIVGLKGARVLHYQRQGPIAEIGIEQTPGKIRCPKCKLVAKVKDRPWVTYVDLSFGSTPARICWKKHRMVCTEPSCDQGSLTLADHRIGAARACSPRGPPSGRLNRSEEAEP